MAVGETDADEVELSGYPLSLAGILLSKQEQAQIEPHTPLASHTPTGIQMFFFRRGVLRGRRLHDDTEAFAAGGSIAAVTMTPGRSTISPRMSESIHPHNWCSHEHATCLIYTSYVHRLHPTFDSRVFGPGCRRRRPLLKHGLIFKCRWEHGHTNLKLYTGLLLELRVALTASTDSRDIWTNSHSPRAGLAAATHLRLGTAGSAD